MVFSPICKTRFYADFINAFFRRFVKDVFSHAKQIPLIFSRRLQKNNFSYKFIA